MRTNQTNKKNNLIYPELSYEIMGILFSVHNRLGSGLREKVYQKAIAEELLARKIPFKEQVYSKLFTSPKTYTKNYLDFEIADKIILEIKVGEVYSPENVQQILDYLKSTDLRLGILANFTFKGVKSKRLVN